MRVSVLLVLLAGGLVGLWFASRSGDVEDAPAEGETHEAESPAPSPFGGRRALPASPTAPPETIAPEEGGVGNEAILRNNRAAKRLEEGDAPGAVVILEPLVLEFPEQESFRHNLAEAHVRVALAQHEERDVSAAVASLERALELFPERPGAADLRELLRRWRAELELETDHWTEDSVLFELSYSTERADILHHSQRVLDHLERTYDELGSWFAADPVRRGERERIRVVLYRQADFGTLTGLGDWAGGAFDGTVRVAVEDLLAEDARWRRVLRHELVHVFIESVGGRGVPGWLNEGCSQLLEGPSLDLAALRRRLGGELFPLEELRGSLASWQDPEAIERAYAQSLLLVERIQREYGDEALRRMLAGCAAGERPAVSFERYTSVPLDFVLGLLSGD